MPTSILQSPSSPSSASVASALSCTRKGRLTYDRDWLSRSDSIERVLQEVTTDITTLNITKNTEETPKNSKKKKSIGATRNNHLTGSSDQKKNAENSEISSPTEVKIKVIQDSVLSPYKVTINREDELNIDSPKNITKANSCIKIKNEKHFEHLTNSIISQDNKSVQVMIERLKISNLDSRYIVNQLEPSSKIDVNDTPKDFLTDDDDDEPPTSPEKTTLDVDFSTPVSRCQVASPTSPEEEELLTFEVKRQQQTEQRLQERKKKWDEDLEKIRERSRLELEARNEETSRQETREMERITLEKEVMERRVREKAVEEQMEREARQRELEEMVKQAENKKLEDMKRQEQLEVDRERLIKIEHGLQRKCDLLTAIWNHAGQAVDLSQDVETATGLISDVEKVVAKLNQLVSQGTVSQQDWSAAQVIGETLDVITQDVNNKINESVREAQRQAEEDKLKQAETAKQEASARAAQEAAKAAEQAIPAPVPVPVLPSAPQAIPAAVAVAAPVQQTPSNLQTFAELTNFKNNYVANIVFSDSEKSFKFDLQRAVNTPMNAISAYSSAHLKDKLDKLTSLLSGNTVTVGDKQLSASSHPSGLPFCLNLAAKMMAQQGENVISSKAEAAFPFATVAIALWDRFPDFGKLLLAHFYEICPFLVPHHPTRHEGQTDKEFYLARGYKYDNEGVVENQDKYLKRMSGIIRLYAALSVVKLPRDSASTSHPRSPLFVWTWLASVMSLDPVADVTATALLCVLEVTGSRMFACYGHQFGKLLGVAAKEYMPLLEMVKVEGGPVERLVDFLAMAIKQKAIKEPEGVLKAGFL